MPLRAGDFESPVSANFTIRALGLVLRSSRCSLRLCLGLNNVTAKPIRSQMGSQLLRVYSSSL